MGMDCSTNSKSSPRCPKNLCNYMQSQYAFFNIWFFDLVVLQCIIILLIMAHKKAHSDRLGRSYLSNRVVGIIVTCALVSLVWFSAGNARHLRETSSALYKQAEQSAASAALIPAGNDRSDVDARLRNATLPAKNVTTPAPFPPLPSPDIEECMAICMAGEYFVSLVEYEIQ